MRATELLERQVVTRDGSELGPVRDARVRRASDGSLNVIGLVVGRGRFAHAAHAWGFAEGRTQGPWLFRALTSRATAAARYIPIEKVDDLTASPIRIACAESDLEPLHRGGRP